MKVLVDTSVWSLALRRRSPQAAEAPALGRLVQQGRVGIIGPIRQELLSGISQAAQFEKLKENLAAFEDLPLVRAHFERAAEFCNACRRKGVQGSHTDFLICAVSSLQRWPIFTADKDFNHYAKLLPVVLFHPSPEAP